MVKHKDLALLDRGGRIKKIPGNLAIADCAVSSTEIGLESSQTIIFILNFVEWRYYYLVLEYDVGGAMVTIVRG